MIATLAHEIAWVAAAPMWKQAVSAPPVLRRPTILGFNHDNFMDEILTTLAKEPERIADRVATGPSRSYRERLPGESFDAKPLVVSQKLKLYQPVHGWFYLVTGSLVCQLPGLPDHPVDLGAGESAGFVVRRLADSTQELALIVDPAGKKSWRPARRVDALADGEEVLPMFPLGFREADRRRKLLAGVIPTGSQDFFLAAPIGEQQTEGGPPSPADAFEAVKGKVTGAIELLQTPPKPPPAPAPDEDQLREISRFVLMDLADFLTFYLPSVMESVRQGTTPSGTKATALVTLLRQRHVDPTVDATKTFADVLKTILATPLNTPFAYNLKNTDTSKKELESALQDALEEATPDALTVAVAPVRVHDTFYVTRLVYQRSPQCGPLKPEVVSPPSEPFLLAPYFDPEAPTRPIRIALPFDPSIQGLRQFRKNVRMVLSDALSKKTKTAQINDKIDGPNVDCGALELSIPIITIVAMIILFVFIILLNIIFWWIPFVKICLPRITVEP
jgi:hypothetical protein